LTSNPKIKIVFRSELKF